MDGMSLRALWLKNQYWLGDIFVTKAKTKSSIIVIDLHLSEFAVTQGSVSLKLELKL